MLPIGHPSVFHGDRLVIQTLSRLQTGTQGIISVIPQRISKQCSQLQVLPLEIQVEVSVNVRIRITYYHPVLLIDDSILFHIYEAYIAGLEGHALSRRRKNGQTGFCRFLRSRVDPVRKITIKYTNRTTDFCQHLSVTYFGNETSIFQGCHLVFIMSDCRPDV